MKPFTFKSVAMTLSMMSALPAQSEPLSEQAVAHLDRAIDTAVAERRIAGTVVLVAHGGEVVYRRAAGLADIEAGRPMEQDTVFRLTSVSKPVVSAAAVRLVEMGLLNLDAPVTDWLPDFRPIYETETPEITLRHLLTHTSGIGYAADEGGSGPYTEAGVQDGGFGLGITLEENLNRLGSVPLRFAPGKGWAYGLGIDVMGRIIERATNLPLEIAIRALVTEPLRMPDTVFHVAAWNEDRLAANYSDGAKGPARIEDGARIPLMGMEVRFDPSRNTDPDSWPSSGAGMSGTAGDLMTLLLALTTEDGFLDGSLEETMMAPQTPPTPVIDLLLDIHGGLPEGDAAWGFGIGGAVLIRPELAKTPQSEGTFAWSGAYGHTWFVDPVEDLIVVAMTNTAWEGIYGTFARDVRDAVYATE